VRRLRASSQRGTRAAAELPAGPLGVPARSWLTDRSAKRVPVGLSQFLRPIRHRQRASGSLLQAEAVQGLRRGADRGWRHHASLCGSPERTRRPR